MAAVAKADRLSLFGTALASNLERQGLTVDRTPPVTYIGRPLYGSNVHGLEILDAYAAEPYGITRVVFQATNRDGRTAVLGAASPTDYGWIFSWDSSGVANGLYMLKAIAYDSIGSSSVSRPVVISVTNR